MASSKACLARWQARSAERSGRARVRPTASTDDEGEERRHTRVEDLVVEDREVEGQSQSDGVSRRKLGNGDVGSGLVSLERLVGGVFALVTGGELGEVSVVVSHPAEANEEGTDGLDNGNRSEGRG
jgi:hypothetical protein